VGTWAIVALALVGGFVVFLVLFELIWRLGEDADPARPDPEVMATFSALTLNEVRNRADGFRRDADAAPRKAAYAYDLPEQQWRWLEQLMRERGADEVADLGDEDVVAWAKRLGVLGRPERPQPPFPALPDKPPNTAVAPVRGRYEWMGRLRVRGGPSMKPRRPRR
jgi:hypothetical protein